MKFLMVASVRIDVRFPSCHGCTVLASGGSERMVQEPEDDREDFLDDGEGETQGWRKRGGGRDEEILIHGMEESPSSHWSKGKIDAIIRMTFHQHLAFLIGVMWSLV